MHVLPILLLLLIAGYATAMPSDSVSPSDIAAKRCLAFATSLKRLHPLTEAKEGHACTISRVRHPKNSTIAYGYALSLWNDKKETEAVAAARVADGLGSIDAPVLLGRAYTSGLGVAQDHSQAYRWFMLGLERKSKRAAFHLANAYQKGLGVGRDPGLAWKLANVGAESGDPNAIVRVAYLLAEGIGTTRNLRLSLEFSLKAAELGNSTAMYNVALCLLEHEMSCGIQKDTSRALEFAKMAAEWGGADGMRLMGYIYQRGTGVPKSDTLAADWYRKAIAAGDGDAQQRLNLLLNPRVRSGRADPAGSCDTYCQQERDNYLHQIGRDVQDELDRSNRDRP